MIKLYHRDDLNKGKKPLHIAADGDLFTAYVRENIHPTNYNEFVTVWKGIKTGLGVYMGYNL